MKVASIVALSLFALAAHADGTANLSWSLATAYEDGAPLPAGEIQSHRVEWSQCLAGDAFGTKVGELMVAMPATSATVAPLAPARWCFRAYTVAVNGMVSNPSNVAAKTVTSGKPGAPTIVQIDIQVTAQLETTEDGALRLSVR